MIDSKRLEGTAMAERWISVTCEIGEKVEKYRELRNCTISVNGKEVIKSERPHDVVNLWRLPLHRCGVESTDPKRFTLFCQLKRPSSFRYDTTFTSLDLEG